MTGLIRIRAKAGMTIPAAPRMTSASESAGGAELGRACHIAFMQEEALLSAHGGRKIPIC